MSNAPFDQMQGFIWLNGNVVKWQDAKTHILTHGLHYGSCVFEGIRVYSSKPFKLKEHIARLYHSASCLRFDIPYTLEELCEVVIEQIKMNNIKDGYVRPFAWRGAETLLIGGGSKVANVAVAAWPIFEDARSNLRSNGIRMNISSWRKPAPNASPYSAKAASIYTISTIVKNDAVASGFDDSIMLDSQENVTEATTSNVFFIKDNQIFTPIPDCFLNGITRQTIIHISNELGYKTYELKIPASEISSFEAAFLTGTAIEIMPIQCIEDKKFEAQHHLILRLSQKYQELTS